MTAIALKIAAGLGLALALGAAQGQASTGSLLGWQVAGDVVSQGGALWLSTAYVDGVNDEAGNLSGSPAVAVDVLAAAAGLPAAALDLSVSDYATEGSLATQVLTVSAGQVLHLSWSLGSQDTRLADHAFLMIGSQVITLATALQAPTGPNSLAYSFAQGGSFLLGLGVVDSVDVLGVSTLRISDLSISAVPEPARFGLMALGLIGLAVLVHRSRRAAHTAW